jgi:hypothetical protein
MHLDDERIERLLAGELDPAADPALARHLGECGDCRARLTEARREDERVRTLLRSVDHAPPAVDVRAVIARERARSPAARRWAAGILLALGLAGGAYAASAPLGRWIDRMRERPGDTLEAAPSMQPPSAPAPSAEPSGGVALDAGGPLLVVFESPAPGTRARVALGDDARLVVQALGGAAGFAESAGRLVITGAAAEFEIIVPRSAPRVELRAGDVRLFVKEGSRVTVAPAGDASGPWLLELEPRP